MFHLFKCQERQTIHTQSLLHYNSIILPKPHNTQVFSRFKTKDQWRRSHWQKWNSLHTSLSSGTNGREGSSHVLRVTKRNQRRKGRDRPLRCWNLDPDIEQEPRPWYWPEPRPWHWRSPDLETDYLLTITTWLLYMLMILLLLLLP